MLTFLLQSADRLDNSFLFGCTWPAAATARARQAGKKAAHHYTTAEYTVHSRDTGNFPQKLSILLIDGFVLC